MSPGHQTFFCQFSNTLDVLSSENEFAMSKVSIFINQEDGEVKPFSRPIYKKKAAVLSYCTCRDFKLYFTTLWTIRKLSLYFKQVCLFVLENRTV